MDDRHRPAQGDEGLLFLEFNDHLLRRVDALVHAAPQTIEDACAFAWLQFLRRQPDRDGQWKSWLVQTAQREAWRLHRTARDVPHVPLGPTRSAEWASEPADPHDRTELHASLDEAVQVLGQLSPRLRRIAFLQASGLHYSEIADVTGDSLSRVSALVRRANEQTSRGDRPCPRGGSRAPTTCPAPTGTRERPAVVARLRTRAGAQQPGRSGRPRHAATRVAASRDGHRRLPPAHRVPRRRASTRTKAGRTRRRTRTRHSQPRDRPPQCRAPDESRARIGTTSPLGRL